MNFSENMDVEGELESAYNAGFAAAEAQFRERAEKAESELAKWQWVKVSEKLPEEGEYVIAHNGNVTAEIKHVGGGKFVWYTWTTDEVQRLYDVTHWMQLPNPPEDV